jgi:ribonuclease HI
MMRILYSDGSCPENGKPMACGGWCAIEVKGGQNVETQELVSTSSGYELPDIGKPNTSIRMELLGAIAALSIVKEPCKGITDRITFFSDSAYVINGINQKWYKSWFRTGKNSFGKEPANMDLWRRLVDIIDFHGAEFIEAVHVRGHKGHRWQELCDSIAVQKSAEAKKRYEGGEKRK